MRKSGPIRDRRRPVLIERLAQRDVALRLQENDDVAEDWRLRDIDSL